MWIFWSCSCLMWNSIIGWKKPMAILLNCLQAQEIVHFAPCRWAQGNYKYFEGYLQNNVPKISVLIHNQRFCYFTLGCQVTVGKKTVFLIFVSKIYDPCQPYAPVWQEPFALLDSQLKCSVFSLGTWAPGSRVSLKSQGVLQTLQHCPEGCQQKLLEPGTDFV